jgi:hypothetical protein
VRMGVVRPIPTLGGVFRDVRGQGRTLRVSWHAEDGLVVLSLWDGPRCTGTVRIASADVPDLLESLAAGYQRPDGEPPTPPPLAPAPPPLAAAPDIGERPVPEEQPGT